MLRALVTTVIRASVTGTKTMSTIVRVRIATAIPRLPPTIESRRFKSGHAVMQTIRAHSIDVRNGLNTQNVDTTSKARKRTERVACVMSPEAR